IGQISQLKNQEIKTNSFLYDYAKRPEIKLYNLLEKIDFLKDVNLSKREIDNLEIRIKFEGYIKNQEEFLKKLQRIDKISLTDIQDYKEVPNIAIEAIEKLNKIKPLNLDQASRISGITLNDIARIKYYLESKKKQND
ncbi:MAG: tRNA uridine-5-carboxymethylaminomethyl(34) synthesis enzyme MnmG, partial [Ureaplasma sp.]|nr:tRNA uridine-5-carboxymethylaminomethyl(34) synthesis enzyme MnmG [Ureaplasma sp.]